MKYTKPEATRRRLTGLMGRLSCGDQQLCDGAVITL